MEHRGFPLCLEASVGFRAALHEGRGLLSKEWEPQGCEAVGILGSIENGCQ